MTAAGRLIRIQKYWLSDTYNVQRILKSAVSHLPQRRSHKTEIDKRNKS